MESLEEKKSILLHLHKKLKTYKHDCLVRKHSNPIKLQVYTDI